MIEKLEHIDRQLFLFLNGLRADWLDVPMWYISSIILWIPLFVFFLYYAYKNGKIILLVKLMAGLGLCIAFADQISVKLFKEVFERVRPTHNLEIMDQVHTVIKPNGEEYRGGVYSFVSSHASNFFAMATFMFLLFREFSKKWWWLFVWAALIAYSRVYLGVHYPADLVCGGILGIVIGWFIYWLSTKVKPLQSHH